MKFPFCCRNDVGTMQRIRKPGEIRKWRSVFTKRAATRPGNRFLAWIFLLVLVLPTKWGLAAQLAEVRIGSSDISFSNFSAFYARDRGLFEKEGIDAKFILVKTEAALAAQSAGDLDYTTFSTSVIDAAAKGIPARLVAVTIKQPAVGLVVRKGIENVTDLKGLKVVVSSFGGLLHVAALYVLKHYGLSSKTVTVLATGPSNSGIAALKAGSIDGIFLAAPYDMVMAQEGFTLLLDVGTLYQLPFGGISATPTKIREKPGEVERVLRAVVQASRLSPTRKTATMCERISFACSSSTRFWRSNSTGGLLLRLAFLERWRWIRSNSPLRARSSAA